MKKGQLICLAAVCIVLYLLIPYADTEASSFKYKDYATGKTKTYYGTIPAYYVNGSKVEMTDEYPMLSEKGYAYASAKALYKDGMGMSVIYSSEKQCLAIKYHGHVLKLYIGETKAELDGVEKEAPCAPFRIKYKKSNKVATMVPTRFVSEALGLDYEWESSDAKVTITTGIYICINGEGMDYSGTRGNIWFEGKRIKQKTGTCSILLSGNAMLNAGTKLFKTAGIDYKYDKNTGIINLTYGDNTIVYKLNSRISYVNGELSKNPYSPIIVEYPDLKKSYVYVPGRFTFESLGFYYNWNDDKDRSEIYYENPDKKGKDSNKEDSRYKLLKIKNTENGYYFESSADTSSQTINIPLAMIKSVNDIEIRENLVECYNEIAIKGNHSKAIEKLEFQNTGEAVLQVRVYYDTKADETLFRFYSLTALGCKPLKYKKGVLTLQFDNIKNIYKKIIVMDAGHGGHDPGAVAYHTNESDLNLNIIKACKELFDKTDVKVYYTRLDDTFITLDDRAALAGSVGADMFISIHHNSSDSSSVKGISIHCCENNHYTSLNGLTGEKLAWRILNSVKAALGSKTFAEGVIKSNFVVIRDSQAPAVLLEVGFVSNKDELEYVKKKSSVNKIAQSIVDTVLAIYKESEEAEKASAKDTDKNKDTDKTTDKTTDKNTDTEKNSKTDKNPDKESPAVTPVG